MLLGAQFQTRDDLPNVPGNQTKQVNSLHREKPVRTGKVIRSTVSHTPNTNVQLVVIITFENLLIEIEFRIGSHPPAFPEGEAAGSIGSKVLLQTLEKEDAQFSILNFSEENSPKLVHR